MDQRTLFSLDFERAVVSVRSFCCADIEKDARIEREGQIRESLDFRQWRPTAA
jgi:hypothetical protein